MRPRPKDGSMTFGVNSRTGGRPHLLAGKLGVQRNQRTRLFESLALDRDGIACQSKVPSVRGGNNGRSTLLCRKWL